ncbi:MFS transporter [Roseibium sp. RKSG952]|uniref:MFS transporter n=1 Tax=Roseibium sp. RKSG952 TaxID=2529384 RepID=UPI0012BD10A6|nr:MFS transporter [Roseibium sp. RKSG952]MTH99891.1 MFS transporter [Roseibium sp. RKSG952]
MFRKHHSFFASMFLTVLADQILLFLVPLVVFQMTGSVAWSGLAFFFETLPRYAAFPVCGILCDRMSPIALLRISRLLRAAVCVAGITGQILFGGVWWLIGLSAIAGVLTTQGLLALEVVLVRAFQTERFEQVASYAQLASQLGVVLAPLAAGYLLAVMPWQGAVVLATALFVLADIAFMAWPGRKAVQPLAGTPQRRHPARDLIQAARLVWTLPGLMGAIAQAAGVNLIVGATLATAAAMMTGLFQQSDQTYAWLLAGGALATVLVLSFTAHARIRLGTLGAVAYTGIFLGAVLTGSGATPWVYAAGFLFIAGFDKMFNIYVRTLRKEIIPPEDFGKTTGMIICLNNLSQPIAGLLVATFASGDDARPVLLALAGGMALLGLASSRRVGLAKRMISRFQLRRNA